jgi:hypothetical protein
LEKKKNFSPKDLYATVLDEVLLVPTPVLETVIQVVIDVGVDEDNRVMMELEELLVDPILVVAAVVEPDDTVVPLELVPVDTDDVDEGKRVMMELEEILVDAILVVAAAVEPDDTVVPLELVLVDTDDVDDVDPL